MASGAIWPDPDPAAGAPPLVDDVTRMNAAPVQRVFCVREEADILRVLELARRDGVPVSIRGTRHSMGGHTIAEGGFVIDCMLLNRHHFDPASGLLTTEPGALWADLITYLNDFGFSPRTMQSYSTFSVGGSLAVNAHGITTDFCGAESVVEFDLIKWDGSKVTCTRGAEGEAGELFTLALGGYGMFGIMSRVVLKVNTNCHLSMDMIQCDSASFTRLYAHALEDGNADVEIKLARMDVTNLDHVDLFIFRRDNPPGMRTISRLGAEPREMSVQQQMLYKWIMPSFKELRYALERATGAAIDWGDENERNLLMFESAAPLARLCNPLFLVDDTFVLQEFFVPQAGYRQWVHDAKPIYRRAEELPKVDLLNTTIRYVHQDLDTALPYSRAEGGSFAFVLYYRIHRTPEADAELNSLHSEFVKITLALGGTFYLPYRHHYTEREMDDAYPNARHFFERKQHYDPTCMFTSSWYERYGRRFWVGETSVAVPSTLAETPAAADPGSAVEVSVVSEHRSDSYARLMGDRRMKADFRDLFLTKIFNIENNRSLFGLMAKACYDPDNTDDQCVYEHLQALLAENGGAMHAVMTTWKQVKQIKAQKSELLKETAGILAHLGRLGNMVGYASIGDNGKMVLPFREHLGLEGLCYVVHDVDPDTYPGGNPAANVERGSVGPVGEFVQIDYTRVEPLRIPSGSVDLVTMNQGLHHLPQGKLPTFLAEVRRILRPSGLFIVREHNASDDLIPMLDLAHSVFNAVTGVSAREERAEIRAFRPILEWRKLVESAGFIDSMLYAMEAGDPTLDEMMCFLKPPFKLDPGSAECEASRLRSKRAAGLAPPVAPRLVPAPIQMAMNHGPTALIDIVRSALGALDGGISGLEAFVNSQSAKLSGGQQFAVTSMTKGFFSTLKMFMARFRPVFEHLQLRENLEAPFPLEELMLVVNSLMAKGERGLASANELAAIAVIKDIKAMFDPAPAPAPEGEADPDQESDDEEFEDARDEQGRTATVEERHPEATSIEIQGLLTRLLEVYPEMASPDFLAHAGFPARAQVALLGQLSSSSSSSSSSSGQGAAAVIREASAGLSAKLDPVAFEEFSRAVSAILATGNVPPLTFDGMQEPSSPWWRVVMAVLGSKRITFTSRGLMMAAMVGLEPVTQMWQVARQARLDQERHALREQRRQALDGAGASVARHQSAVIDEHSRRGLAAALEWISDSVHTVSIPVGTGQQTEPRVLTDVKEIVEATIYVEQRQANGQLLKEQHDCTVFLRNQVLKHNGGSGTGADCTVRIGSDELDRVLEWLDLEVGSASPPVHEAPRPYRFGDITKGVLSAVASVAADISSPMTAPPARVSCVIQYSVQDAAEPDPDAYLPHVKVLLERCKRAGQLQELHSGDGEYTWLKLSEWMQVEILEIYAQSLSHTPWYRFPYLDMVSLYWRVLSQEMGIVAEKHGLKKALFSSAVATDVVPGIFMAVLFGQLQLLALPLKAFLGESYDADEAMVEQLVVLTGEVEPKWHEIDSRITEPTRLMPKLFTLLVPTFKPLTEILLKLAAADSWLSVLQISNNDQVQVRVELHPATVANDLLLLEEKRGCQVMFSYQFPVDGTPVESSAQNGSGAGGQQVATTVSLCVDVPYLLAVLRFCSTQGIVVKQVYDWWS